MPIKNIRLFASRVLRAALLALIPLSTQFTILPAHAGAAAPLLIGQVIDLSGSDAAMGRDYTAGIRTFFDMANKAGGVGGRKVEFIVRDDKGDPKLATEAAEELAGRENVQFLFGGIGETNTQAVIKSNAFRRSGLTLYAPLAVAVSSARVTLWRPRYERELTFLLRYFEKAGIASVALAVQQDGLQQHALKHVQSLLKNSRLHSKGSVTLSGDPAQLAGQARQLAALGPGVVIVLSDAVGSGLFLKAYRAHNPSGYVAGTALTNLVTLQELAGQDGLQWTLFSQVVPNPNGTSTRLQKEHLEMMRKYRDEPVSALTLEGFAAAKTLASLIEKNAIGKRQGMQTIQITSPLDLGDFVVRSGSVEDGLSSWLDLALLRRGGQLRY